MNNWEKKSSYLLREIIKFRTYIDTLQAAMTRREAVAHERVSWAAAKKGGAPFVPSEKIDLDCITPRLDLGALGGGFA